MKRSSFLISLGSLCACLALATQAGCQARERPTTTTQWRTCHQSLFTLGPIMTSTASGKPCDGLVDAEARTLALSR